LAGRKNVTLGRRVNNNGKRAMPRSARAEPFTVLETALTVSLLKTL
jgi:hypothetical protein